MKVIKDEYSRGTQSVNYVKIIENAEGTKIKIDIKSDSYDFQSYARVSAFSPTDLKWNTISSIAFSEMKTPAQLYYKIGGKSPASIVSDEFEQDTQELTNQAADIIGQSFSTIVVKKVTTKPK